MIGEVLSDFRIIEKFGVGARGEVFLADDTNLNHCDPERSRAHSALRSERRESGGLKCVIGR